MSRKGKCRPIIMNRLLAHRIVLVCVVVLTSGQQGFSTEKPTIAGHQTMEIAGWTVFVSDKLVEQDEVATKGALELLTLQLDEIVHKVPASVALELRKVPLWFSLEYEGVPPRAEYHPNAAWLRQHKRDPAMEKGIEFTNVRIFERETKRMPNFALHELAHAYHDQVLTDGFDNAELKATFKKANANGLYESVEQRLGDGRTAQVRSYALANHKEYFAECSEAFFSSNDFFPFTREQLAKYDPEMFALLARLWAESDVTK